MSESDEVSSLDVKDYKTEGLISFDAFYGEYHGHTIRHLLQLHDFLRNYHKGKKRFIFLVGDSSLDNKAWFNSVAKAVNGYEKIISGQHANQDVAYWINEISAQQNLPYCCINGAVEESTLGARDSILKRHDKFVRQSLRDGDVLICSVGGNDIALAPTLRTICNMALVVKVASKERIENGTAWGMSYLIAMFKDKIRRYLERIIGDTKVSKVLVCMIYYPALVGSGWADTALSAMGYSTQKNPDRLQLMIRSAFEHATCQIRLRGIADHDVIPVPLFEILDPLNKHDYVARVDPSPQGGRKMASKFLDAIQRPGMSSREGFWKWTEKSSPASASSRI
eukprot:gene712-59_t